MRTFIVPTSEMLHNKTEYTFRNFLAEFVWPAPEWRASDEAVKAWYEARAAIGEATPGSMVVMEDLTWQFFKPLATMVNKPLPIGDVSERISNLMQPIFTAKSISIPELTAKQQGAES